MREIHVAWHSCNHFLQIFKQLGTVLDNRHKKQSRLNPKEAVVKALRAVPDSICDCFGSFGTEIPRPVYGRPFEPDNFYSWAFWDAGRGGTDYLCISIEFQASHIWRGFCYLTCRCAMIS